MVRAGRWVQPSIRQCHRSWDALGNGPPAGRLPRLLAAVAAAERNSSAEFLSGAEARVHGLLTRFSAVAGPRFELAIRRLELAIHPGDRGLVICAAVEHVVDAACGGRRPLDGERAMLDLDLAAASAGKIV